MAENPHDNKPPLFKTWTGWYLFVILCLVAQIVFYYYLTKIYS